MPRPRPRDRTAGYLTNLAGRLFVRALAQRLDAIGLSIGHMPVFAALGGGGAMTQKDLAAKAVVEQPTMAATLARMERDGLVARLPNPQDARSALVSLTPAALAKVKELDAAIADVNKVATATLTRSERAEYPRLIGKIIAALEAAGAAGDD
jgi:DNA-binding MarR family transcriptional regulator